MEIVKNFQATWEADFWSISTKVEEICNKNGGAIKKIEKNVTMYFETTYEADYWYWYY
jgi:hypothetical protein